MACPEHLGGDREIPDHPLVNQTLDDCLHEAMDLEGLKDLLVRLEKGTCRFIVCDVSEPSLLAQELVSARPYAFLDDAPLEERRTRAVAARGSSDLRETKNAVLEPEIILKVAHEAWPSPRSPDELHDALWTGGFLTETEIQTGHPNQSWWPWLEELKLSNRVGSFLSKTGAAFWVASERWAEALSAFPEASPQFHPSLPESLSKPFTEGQFQALRDMLRSRLEISGPITSATLMAILGFSQAEMDSQLLGLEAEGFLFRGQFPLPITSSASLRSSTSRYSEHSSTAIQWLGRRLLFRMRQLSVAHRRHSGAPGQIHQSGGVPVHQYQEFLFQWQGCLPFHDKLGSPERLVETLQRLEGFEAPADLWEREILKTRIPHYQSASLDAICVSGQFCFGRLCPPESGSSPSSFLSLRHLPLAFFPRSDLRTWKRLSGSSSVPISGVAQELEEILQRKGASFADEIHSEIRLLPEDAERGLRSLLFTGRATCDSFAGLRVLMRPARIASKNHFSGTSHPRSRLALPPGRFFLLPTFDPKGTTQLKLESEEDHLFAARILLQRYGILFRRLAERSAEGSFMPPWQALRKALYTLEDRGEVRGGRFIKGLSGEQFALPEALEKLSSSQSDHKLSPYLVLSSFDPANLQGWLTPERRVPCHPKNLVLFSGGIPKIAWEGQKVRELSPFPSPDTAKAGLEYLMEHLKNRGKKPFF